MNRPDVKYSSQSVTISPKVIWDKAASPHCWQTNWYPPRTIIEPYLPGGTNLHAGLINGSIGPTRPTTLNGNSIESAVFTQFTVVTNGRTDRQTDRTSAELRRYQQAAYTICTKRLNYIDIVISIDSDIGE